MNDIPINTLYDLYYDAISKCTSNLMLLDDEDIKYILYEDFDISAISFLHDNSLSRLLSAGIINNKEAILSRNIRNIWMDIQNYDISIEEIKKNIHFSKLFNLCDKLILLLESKKNTA